MGVVLGAVVDVAGAVAPLGDAPVETEATSGSVSVILSLVLGLASYPVVVLVFLFSLVLLCLPLIPDGLLVIALCSCYSCYLIDEANPLDPLLPCIDRPPPC